MDEMKLLRSSYKQKGSILVTILVTSLFLTMLLLGVMILADANLKRARGRILQLQAQYSAESGADVAIAKLNDSSNPLADTYTGSPTETQVLNAKQYRSTFKTTVVSGSNPKEKVITSTGYVYAPKTATNPTNKRTIRVIAQRSSGTTASSVLSRTIIDVASSVKSISARDIYVNDYLNLQKNSNTIVADSITVVGKDASAQKCSIVGPGVLQKPTSFHDPAQTKAKLSLGFNNCINPPGNYTNSNFDVLANDTSLRPIQSLRIPWNQYMDDIYQPSVSGCSDWTTGGTSRQIPRVGNDKKTHYPDDGSNISATCGTNGNVDLGSDTTFVIRDNVHLRANLCATAACNPIFNNPNPATMRFVFVEGTINFDSLRTTAGSGPIVFVTYGADPASKIKSCPHGGSLYLGKSNIETRAPAAYLLATYGLCLDQTKFALDAPALGGIGGKSVFISTNSGNPWSLRLDPNFPLSQIPIDLSWRQSSYQRL